MPRVRMQPSGKPPTQSRTESNAGDAEQHEEQREDKRGMTQAL